MFPGYDGISYHVQVRGVKSDGRKGETADLIAQTWFDAPTAVSNIEVTSGDTEPSVSWTVGNNNDRWNVIYYQRDELVSSYFVESPSTTITGLENADEYKIEVEGWRDLGEDPFGQEQSVAAPREHAYSMPLAAPESVEVVDITTSEPDMVFRPGLLPLPPDDDHESDEAVRVSWDAVEGAFVD